MIISVTFRNSEGEAWQREYVEDKLNKLKKYVDYPVEAHVVLSVEKFRNVADINLTSNGLNINAKEEEKEMHLAIDNAILKIERQLKKRKEKIRGYKNNSLREEGAGSVSPESEEIDDLPGDRVVKVRQMILTPMTLDDALMEMETTKNRFLVYRDSATENISIIYRRDDGNFTLFETKG